MTRRRAEAALQFGLLAAIALGVVGVLATTSADVDLWGHLRFGLDLLQSRTFPAQDPYSFTTDRPWVNHEWLAELLFALSWRWAGAAGLIGLKLACIGGAIAFVERTLANAAVKADTRFLLLGLGVAGMLPRVTHVRPQLFSVLLFAALLFVVTHRPAAPRRLLWAVPLLALWANLHGGWIVGLATLGVWCAGLVWESRDRGVRALWPLGLPLLAAVATLGNPEGVGLWRFLLETVRFGRTAISEWGPVWLEPVSLVIWLLFAGLAGAAIAGVARRRELLVRPAAVLLPVLWGVASLRVNRLDSFFVLSAISLLGPKLESLVGPQAAARTSPSPPLPRSIRALIVAVLLTGAVALPAGRQAIGCIQMQSRWWPEPEVAAFFADRKLSGRTVTFFRWGEYAIWNLPPDIAISMDGRRETVYSQGVIDGHLELYDGTPRGLDYLDSLRADFVWLPSALPVVSTLQARGWRPIFRGPASTVLAGDLHADVTPLDVTTVPASRCFPGP